MDSRIFNIISAVVLPCLFMSCWAYGVPHAHAGESCVAPLDIVLVFDRSDSMVYDSPLENNAYIEPYQPLTDAQNGTRTFIGLLSKDDRIGLVNFYGSAKLANSITTNFASVIGSVDEIWVGSWSDIGAGIDIAHKEILENGRTDVKQVIIILSDGNPSKQSVDKSILQDYVLQKAGEAKADDIIIYTIGYGDDVNATLLQDIASDPSNYYFAPTSEGIKDAYVKLDESICNHPPVAHLGKNQVVSVGSVVNFDGTGSYDPDGSIISYDWDFSTGEKESGKQVSYVFTKAGTYPVSLTVKDRHGSSDVAIVEIAVKNPDGTISDNKEEPTDDKKSGLDQSGGLTYNPTFAAVVGVVVDHIVGILIVCVVFIFGIIVAKIQKSQKKKS